MNENNNNTKRDRNARALNDTRFTLCDVARELNINEKIARRRMRRAIACNDERLIAIVELRNTNDARVRYEFANEHRETIARIIARD